MRKIKKNKTAPPEEKLISTISFPPIFQILIWGIISWAIFCWVRYDQKYPLSVDAVFDFIKAFAISFSSKTIRVIPSYLFSIFVAFFLVIGMVGWGHLLLKNLNLGWDEKVVLSLGLGAVLLSASIFTIGVSGLCNSQAYAVFSILFVIVGGALSRGFLSDVRDHVKALPVSNLFVKPVNCLFVLFAVLSLVMCLVPELFYDSLVYHLGLPQIFLNEGRIINTPSVYFSRFPMLMHMLYLLGVALDGSNVAKLLNWTFMMMGMLTIRLLCRRLGFEKDSVWGALFVISIPVLQMVNWSTPVDSALGGFTILAAFFLVLFQDESFQTMHTVLILGLLVGAIFAVKYTGAVMIIVFSFFFTFVIMKKNKMWIAKALLLFGFCASLPSMPYLIRNTLWANNPVYPIATKYLNPDISPKIINEQKVITRHKPKNIREWVVYPWKQTMLEQSNFNFIGPMTLCGLPLLMLIFFLKQKTGRLYLLLTMSYFVLSLCFSGDIRYLLPGFYLLGVAMAYGMHVSRSSGIISTSVLRSIYFGLALYHLGWLTHVNLNLYRPVQVLCGNQTREEYSATMHNGLNLWPWNAMKGTLLSLPNPCRVYMLGNEQVFGFPRRFWYSSVHDETPLVLWANASKNAEELFDKVVREEKFTHILLNAPESMRLEGYKLYPWNEQGKKNFIEFAKQHFELIDVKGIDQFADSLFLFKLVEQVPKEKQMQKFDTFFKPVFYF